MKTNWPAFGFGCLLLAGAAIAVLPAGAQDAQGTSASTAVPVASISAVEVAQPGPQTTVHISGTGELHYRTSRLDSPPRLVMDFADTRLKVARYKVSSEYAPVLDVRMGQPTPGQSRVVIDLAKRVPFTVQANGSDVTISFTAQDTLATPAALPLAKKPAQHRLVASKMPLPASLTGKDTGFARPADAQNAPAAATDPSSQASSQTAASALPMDTQDAPAPPPPAPASAPAAPDAQTAPTTPPPPSEPASAPATPDTQSAPAPAAPASAPVAPDTQPATPTTPAPASAPVSPTPLNLPGFSPTAPATTPATTEPAPAPAPAPQALAPAPAPAVAPAAPVPQAAPAADIQVPGNTNFTGDPISVNLKDVDLKDFFRLIHEVSGLNIVLDPAVHGTVTLVLDEIPWDQALDLVLRNNGLAKELNGKVLRITLPDTLKHEADQHRDLNKAQVEATEPVTVTRELSYAKAATMAPLLKKFLTARGDIISDTRMNTLIISDLPSSMPKIDNLLKMLDRKTKQVEIDARVVQATRSFAHEIGTQFGFSTPTGSAGNTAIGGVGGIGLLATPLLHNITNLITPSGTSPPLAFNSPANGATSGFTFATQGHNYALDFVLSLMENRGVGKIISEPKGITQNNEKLTVKQGEQIPITTNINNTITTQYVDAVLKLDVTPQITADGTVYMDITIENTQIDASVSVQGTPGLTTQSTQTKVIGGVVITQQQTTIVQVPLLGDVPLIGNLFKHTAVSTSTQELMFFVTPRILPG